MLSEDSRNVKITFPTCWELFLNPGPALHSSGAGFGFALLFQDLLLFPSRVATEQQSVTLVKRLLATSVSCITYMRGLFPESSYGTRYLDGKSSGGAELLLAVFWL